MLTPEEINDFAKATLSRYSQERAQARWREQMERAMDDGYRIYEYVVVVHPTQKDAEGGAKPCLAVLPECVVAKNEDEVRVEAIRRVDQNIDASRLEVVIRPFRAR